MARCLGEAVAQEQPARRGARTPEKTHGTGLRGTWRRCGLCNCDTTLPEVGHRAGRVIVRDECAGQAVQWTQARPAARPPSAPYRVTYPVNWQGRAADGADHDRPDGLKSVGTARHAIAPSMTKDAPTGPLTQKPTTASNERRGRMAKSDEDSVLWARKAH